MADGERSEPPAGRDRGKRLEDEVAPGELGVRDREAPRAPFAAAPQYDVEVEHARAPAAAAAAAEFALDRLEAPQYLGRFDGAFAQRHGVGEVASRTAPNTAAAP